ncbi:MAG: DUF120 domain-containing protein [Candidatus Bathyarchaeia archaeon]
MSEVAASRRLKPYLWFTLYGLLSLGAGSESIKVSTTELSALLGGSQQSASRHLKLLERMGLVTRRIGSTGSLIRITDEGMRALTEVFYALKRHIEEGEVETLVFEGVVFSGLYEGSYYIGQEGYRDQIREKLGFDPYLGTLNLRLRDEDLDRRRQLDRLPAIVLDGFKGEERAFGSARCYPALVNDEVEGALIVAERTTYDLSVMEIISPVYLRGRFGLEDGDTLRVSVSSHQRSSP